MKLSKSFKKTLGVLLALIFVVGAVIGGMELWASGKYKPSNWGNSTTEQGEGDKTPEPSNGGTTKAEVGSFVLQAPETNGGTGISLAMAISDDTAEEIKSVVTITATLFPSLNGTLEWVAEFVNPQSRWAINKRVEDYVTVTFVSALACRVECLRAFGEQILIKAALVDNPSIRATCTADYRQKAECTGVGLEIMADGTEYNFYKNQMLFNAGKMPDFNDPTVVLALSDVYTLPFDNDYSGEVSVSIKIHEELAKYLKTYVPQASHGGLSFSNTCEDWEQVKTVEVANFGDFSDGENINLYCDEINSANFLSRLWKLMYDNAGGFSETYLNIFVQALNSMIANPTLSALTDNGKSVPICYVKTVITVGNVNYEKVSELKVEKAYIKVQSMTLDQDNIEF